MKIGGALKFRHKDSEGRCNGGGERKIPKAGFGSRTLGLDRNFVKYYRV